MIKKIATIVLVCACAFVRAQTSIIATIAGNGALGYSGDGALATDAKLYWPSGICVDKYGDVFFTDDGNHRVRKIDAVTGVISTICGTGTAGYNGDGIDATSAQLTGPESICLDSVGNLYIADGLNHRIRRIDMASNLITTVAGNGSGGYSGDGGMATNAKINAPGGVSIDLYRNIYIADYWNDRIRKVDAITGVITTVAGTGVTGYSGDNGAASVAKINRPGHVCTDSYGNIFFTEVGNSTVRKVSVSSGIITTIAGNGTQGYSGDNGPSSASKLNQPYGIFIDSLNNIYIDEWGNGTIRKIDGATGIITTVVGCGVQGFSGDGGPATAAKLQPDGVWVDKYGTIYIADFDNNRIRKVYNPKLFTPQQPTPSPLITIYPNPTQNELTIEYKFANGEDGILQITDLAGRVVATKVLTSQKEKETINIATLSPGLYLYKVVTLSLSKGANPIISAGKLIKE